MERHEPMESRSGQERGAFALEADRIEALKTYADSPVDSMGRAERDRIGTAIEVRIDVRVRLERDRYQLETHAFTHERGGPEKFADTGELHDTQEGNFEQCPEAAALLPEDPVDRKMVIRSFDGEVERVRLEPGSKVYRMVDREGRLDRCYWSPTEPQSEEEQRKTLAITEDMNGDGAYVECTVPEGVTMYAIRGKAAAQECDLPGGGKGHYKGDGVQLYIKPEDAKKLIADGSPTYHKMGNRS